MDPNIRTAKVRLEVENPGLMRFGMFVTATFHGRQGKARDRAGHRDPAPARPRVGLYAAGNGRFRRVEVVAGNMLPGNTAGNRFGHRAGRTGGRERAGVPEHGGAIDDSPRRRFRSQQPPASSSPWRFCCSSGGIVAFHNLPIEAYPDVADNYVEIITQWPGISAEQIEQQVTIPLEIAMNGIPQVTHLRSFSLFGLSDLKLIFDDDSDNDWNRERVLERLSQVTLPPGVMPQMGTDWSPAGQIYFFTLHSTNPAVRRDGAEIPRRLGGREESQIRARLSSTSPASAAPRANIRFASIPNKLIAYGLSLAQVEQQLTNNNVNAGGSFIEAGLQQINVREVGLVSNVHDIENTVHPTKNGTPLRVKDIAVVAQGPKIRLGQFGTRHSPRRRQDHRQRRCGFGMGADAKRRRRRNRARRSPRKS